MLVEGGPAVWRRGTTDTERGRTFFQDLKRRGLRIHFWWPAMGRLGGLRGRGVLANACHISLLVGRSA